MSWWRSYAAAGGTSPTGGWPGKDLWLWQDGSTWTVGARHGDSDSELWRRPFDREDEDRGLIDSIVKRNGGRKVCLDMTSLVQDSPRRRG